MVESEGRKRFLYLQEQWPPAANLACVLVVGQSLRAQAGTAKLPYLTHEAIVLGIYLCRTHPGSHTTPPLAER